MYILKRHYEATEKNSYFFGDKIDYYYGVGDWLISVNEMPNPTLVKLHGYKTLAGAKTGLRAESKLAESETARGYWNVSVELLEV